MRQYHEDVWTVLYESRLEFERKEKEGEAVENVRDEEEGEMEEEEPSADEGMTMTWSRKRKNTTELRGKKKRRRRNGDNFKKLRLLTYREVHEELGEKPISAGKGKRWTTRESIFQLLFFPRNVGHRIEDVTAQGWKNLPYLHGLNRAMAELEKGFLTEELRRALAMLFYRYCICIPSVSSYKWMAGDNSKKRPAWLAFDKNGDRIDGNKEDSSWRSETRIDEDWCWGLPAETAVTRETLREARWGFKDHGTWKIYHKTDRNIYILDG